MPKLMLHLNTNTINAKSQVTLPPLPPMDAELDSVPCKKELLFSADFRHFQRFYYNEKLTKSTPIFSTFFILRIDSVFLIIRATESQKAKSDSQVEQKNKKVKTMKNYNEQLEQKGDSNFIMKKTITKNNEVKKAFVFMPDSNEKAEAVKNKFSYKGDSNELKNCFLVIADSKIIIRIEKDSGRVFHSDFTNKGYTKRGIRINEKYLEGACDYCKVYLQKEAELVLDSNLDSKNDCFKTTAKELTIDDLLDL